MGKDRKELNNGVVPENWEDFKKEIPDFDKLFGKYEGVLRKLMEARLKAYQEEKQESFDAVIAVNRELMEQPDEFFKKCEGVITTIKEMYPVKFSERKITIRK